MLWLKPFMRLLHCHFYHRNNFQAQFIMLTSDLDWPSITIQTSSFKSLLLTRTHFFLFTGGFEISCSGFSRISQLLERVLMEHIDIKVRPDSKLQIGSICSIRIRSGSWDTVEKPLQIILNPYVIGTKKGERVNMGFFHEHHTASLTWICILHLLKLK